MLCTPIPCFLLKLLSLLSIFQARALIGRNMNRRNKNLVRVLVLAAIFAWPGVETYRYFTATQCLAASEQLLVQVNHQLAQARAKQDSGVMPASHKLRQ